MITIEKIETYGWEAAIRGMRNPKNSWGKSDSVFASYPGDAATEAYAFNIGENDKKLMKSLIKGGPVHSKFMRMITVTCDITAPLYWWKEFDTYKVGTVADSCSTMHKIHAKEFTLEDFSTEHLINVKDIPYQMEDCIICDIDFGKEPSYKIRDGVPLIMPINDDPRVLVTPKEILLQTIDMLNRCRDLYLETKDKRYWWQMIQLLPSSYNQKRTVQFNYSVLENIYRWRKDHKLDEWRMFCNILVAYLPYSELFTYAVDSEEIEEERSNTLASFAYACLLDGNIDEAKDYLLDAINKYEDKKEERG